jgi:hypothetical protein
LIETAYIGADFYTTECLLSTRNLLSSTVDGWCNNNYCLQLKPTGTNNFFNCVMMEALNSLILSSINNQTCPISDVTGERIDKGNYKYIMKNRCFRFTNLEFQLPYYNYTFDNWFNLNTL